MKFGSGKRSGRALKNQSGFLFVPVFATKFVGPFANIFLTMALVLKASNAFASGQAISPDLKKAPVVLAGVEAAFSFAAEFEQTFGRPIANEFVGFSAQSAPSEVEVRVLSILASGETGKDVFGCHFHLNSGGAVEDVHCHNEQQQSIVSYSPSAKGFSVEEFQTSAAEAVKIFERKVGTPSLIEKAKFWRSGDTVQVAFKHTPAGQVEKTNYYMCHYHSGHIDCHGQSRPGPSEPQD